MAETEAAIFIPKHLKSLSEISKCAGRTPFRTLLGFRSGSAADSGGL